LRRRAASSAPRRCGPPAGCGAARYESSCCHEQRYPQAPGPGGLGGTNSDVRSSSYQWLGIFCTDKTACYRTSINKMGMPQISTNITNHHYST
jgi:hypothetical protein